MMPSKSPLSSSEDTLRNITPNTLTLASEEATVEWKNDFLALFHDAKNRFPDIVWRTPDGKEAVWGHKGAVTSQVFHYPKVGLSTSKNTTQIIESLCPSSILSRKLNSNISWKGKLISQKDRWMFKVHCSPYPPEEHEPFQ